MRIINAFHFINRKIQPKRLSRGSFIISYLIEMTVGVIQMHVRIKLAAFTLLLVLLISSNNTVDDWQGVNQNDSKMPIPLFDTHDIGMGNESTNVSWDYSTRNSTDASGWESEGWVFGPTASYKFIQENGSEIECFSSLEIGVEYTISIDIPKSIFTVGDRLGSVTLHMWYFSVNMTYEAHADIGWAEGVAFNHNSYISIDGVPGPSFLDRNFAGCVFVESSTSYSIDIPVTFNSNTILGLYKAELGIGNQDYYSVESHLPPEYQTLDTYGIGIPYEDAVFESVGGAYTIHKQDLSSNRLYSLTRGEDFIVSVDTYGYSAETIQLDLEIPGTLPIIINQTGEHTEKAYVLGGWIYDDTIGGYVYNSSIEVPSTESVYGQYEIRDYTYLDTRVEVEVQSLVHYAPTWEWEVQNISYTANKKFMFVYNGTSFETKFGYQYFEYPADYFLGYQTRDYPYTTPKLVTVYEPVPVDIPVLFELNENLCSFLLEEAHTHVEFVGHVTDLAAATSMYPYLEFDATALRSDGWRLVPDGLKDEILQTEEEYELECDLVIEMPVTISRMLDSDGGELSNEVIHFEKGESIRFEGQLQGASSVMERIHGVELSLEAHNEWIENNEQRACNMRYYLDIDLDGQSSITVYNTTTKRNYTYGIHYDYVYELVEGWVQYYNSSLGQTQWVFEPHYEWVPKLTESWFWKLWYFNQAEQTWQDEYLSEYDDAREYSANVGLIDNFTVISTEGEITVIFDLQMSEEVMDSEYWWSIRFLEDTWFYSDSEKDLLGGYWDERLAYSFDLNDTRHYVGTFEDNQLAYYNDTLCSMIGEEYLLGKEGAYITIGNENLPIASWIEYNQWSDETYLRHLVRGSWNSIEYRYDFKYELLNGTEITVGYTTSAKIFNISLNNGMTFLTPQSSPIIWKTNADIYYSWTDINGDIIQGTNSVDYQPASVSLKTTIPIQFDSYEFIVRYGLNSTLLLSRDWVWDASSSSYFMMSQSGGLYSVRYNYTEDLYYSNINGTDYVVSEPIRYYDSILNGFDIGVANIQYSKFWFHESDGIKYEMPYPGANAEEEWQLDRTISDGGLLPVVKSVRYLDNYYTVQDDGEGPFVEVNGTNHSLVEYHVRYGFYNDTEIWSPTTYGYSIESGWYDDRLNFHPIENILYSGPAYSCPEGLALDLLNGTTWLLNRTYLYLIFEFDANGSSIFSTMVYPDGVEVGPDTIWFYTLLNGTMYNITDGSGLPLLNITMIETYNNGTHDVFDFNGQTYVRPSFSFTKVYTHRVLNATYTGDLFLTFDGEYLNAFQFEYHGVLVNATAQNEHIYWKQVTLGSVYMYGPHELVTPTYQYPQTMFIGNPRGGLWGVKQWVYNDENGAIDLDGNLETEEDQFFVYEHISSYDIYSTSLESLEVQLRWDPNATLIGDEMLVVSLMGIKTFSWTTTWSSTHTWFYADTMEPISSEDMDFVRDVVFTDAGEYTPGYWDIAWVAKNTTFSEINADAYENGWNWVDEDVQSWSWLVFKIDQHYNSSYESDGIEHLLDIDFSYEFSGLLLWDNMNEDGEMDIDLENPADSDLTHYLLPESVQKIDFVFPGESFGIFNSSGDLSVNLIDEVVWGISFINITNTAFPYTDDGYWDWYTSVVIGNDLESFDERPTRITIDKISFLAQFQGIVNYEQDELHNFADIKVDNYIGNFDVQFVGGKENLENRSLALNYYAESSVSDFVFLADEQEVDSESLFSADKFDLEMAGHRFAEMIMGGTTYEWSFDTSESFNVTCQTTPIGVFQRAYESDSGQSATSWTFTANQFYVTIGFPHWSGYSVYQDPMIRTYTSKGFLIVPVEVEFAAFSFLPMSPTASDYVNVSVNIQSTVPILDVNLLFGIEDDNLNYTTEMILESINKYVGTIPPFETGKSVYYKVLVQTSDGIFESSIRSYLVGASTTTTTTTIVTDIGILTTILAGGCAAVIIIFIVIYKRKR